MSITSRAASGFPDAKNKSCAKLNSPRNMAIFPDNRFLSSKFWKKVHHIQSLLNINVKCPFLSYNKTCSLHDQLNKMCIVFEIISEVNHWFYCHKLRFWCWYVSGVSKQIFGNVKSSTQLNCNTVIPILSK